MNKKRVKQLWVDPDFIPMIKLEALRHNLTVIKYTKKLAKETKESAEARGYKLGF